MATIDDLDLPDFDSLSDEELLDLIKDVRARRRTPAPEVREKARKKAVYKQKRGKAVALQNVSKMMEGISAADAAELLKKLGGE